MADGRSPAGVRDWLGLLRRPRADRPVDEQHAGAPLVIDRIVHEPGGTLRFDRGPRAYRLQIDADDEAAFLAIRRHDEAIVEFRAVEPAIGRNWQLLILQDGDGEGRWGRGYMIARRAPSFGGRFSPPDAMATMSALISEFRHELRQPIAAISLAAHNGATKLRSGQTDKALAKFDAILDHVDRCDEIFGRSSLEMYADSQPSEDVDLDVALMRAIGDLRPVLLFAGVGLRIRGNAPGFVVAMPRGGADMMVRAMIGQAFDAILARRNGEGAGACGTILVDRSIDRSGITLHIQDDGLPIQYGATREGLAFSMARYLIRRTGGAIGFDQPGLGPAITGLTVRLPHRAIGVAPVTRRPTADAQELATSLR
jgi:signal transduction histidine kinase